MLLSKFVRARHRRTKSAKEHTTWQISRNSTPKKPPSILASVPNSLGQAARHSGGKNGHHRQGRGPRPDRDGFHPATRSGLPAAADSLGKGARPSACPHRRELEPACAVGEHPQEPGRDNRCACRPGQLGAGVERHTPAASR